MAEVEASCRAEAEDQAIEFRQTNSEAQMIDWIHEAIDAGSGIVINPAAFTSTSQPAEGGTHPPSHYL